jgi:molecular chaperone DnaJ
VNLKEARSILEISSAASPEEAKKKYRELTKKYHPDVNKGPGAEDKFKKINEAYQVVSTGKGTDREEQNWQQTVTRHPFNPFAQQKTYHSAPISTKINITFAESVLGCEKEISFNRFSKCTSCNGQGEKNINNGCTTCGGKGQVIQRQGNMVMIMECPTCTGKTQKNNCVPCKGKGVIEMEASARVNVPGGVVDTNTLRLSGMGHYAGSFGPIEQHGDVHLHIKVIADPGLTLEGINVVCSLELSLQEALLGCKKIVKTINGYQDISINSLVRNKDEVVIPYLGVNKVGNQRVILDVKYPEDITKLIEALDNSTNYKVN